MHTSVKVKKVSALEIREARFLRWLYMSCRLHLYRFYVGETIISRITSNLNFPPLCQNLSRKCKQTWKNLSPIIILSLRCSISSELWEPLNKHIYTEESRTYYATPITSLLCTNDVILTNQRVFSIMTLNIQRRNNNFDTETQNSLRRRPVLNLLS